MILEDWAIKIGKKGKSDRYISCKKEGRGKQRYRKDKKEKEREKYKLRDANLLCETEKSEKER